LNGKMVRSKTYINTTQSNHKSYALTYKHLMLIEFVILYHISLSCFIREHCQFVISVMIFITYAYY